MSDQHPLKDPACLILIFFMSLTTVFGFAAGVISAHKSQAAARADEMEPMMFTFECDWPGCYSSATGPISSYPETATNWRTIGNRRHVRWYACPLHRDHGPEDFLHAIEEAYQQLQEPRP